ncbi:sulfate ABC transporter permease subunit CysT [Aurantimonas endophytica]|uniref:Sulfate transport system permease protein CysT n=1 Tax=Aurantimonas endophytica TaxID=1522175 RepID=A0A7W6HBI0_9HYPH|nr:sulfate ABC transporter permease subunit CysT [Aurantimonas endophytica]MBB4002159.1 sulfate transport system permease protein [Aurantimonas endophytica]MCO6402212.1 sulfate ABC transporter permease subunit CysT [Aurantimonas endophytica]
MANIRFREPSIIPGFRLTFGFTVFYLMLIVIIPIVGLFLKTFELDWESFVRIVTGPRFLAALQLSFGTSLLAALFNVVIGVLTAWVLVRYDFTGRRLLDAIIDLPFALPTAVAGIALTALYVPQGWIGSLFTPYGITIAYTPVGIWIALVFIGLPFVVRTVQPVLEDVNREVEEAAATLGAPRRTTILRVILPPLIPAILTGFALAFARAVGEYGSVIFIAGNIPRQTEILPLLIVFRLEEREYAAAAAIAAVMLTISFAILLLVNFLQAWSYRRFGNG